MIREAHSESSVRPGSCQSLFRPCHAPREPSKLAINAVQPVWWLAPSPAQFDEIVEAYGYVRAMTARLKSGFDYDAEPAHVFVPERT